MRVENVMTDKKIRRARDFAKIKKISKLNDINILKLDADYWFATINHFIFLDSLR